MTYHFQMGVQRFEQKIQTSKLRGDAWLYCKSSKYLAGESKLCLLKSC